MKLKQLMDFEMDKNKKSSLQVKAVKALAGFLILMFLLTILSRAADSLTIAKVTASAATGGVISHNIEVDGNITPNKDIAISTSANIKIASVEATEGKTVKKGDLLIQLDPADLKKKLLQAQKELQVAKATASDKKANEAIAADTKSKSLQRTYEDYNQTVADANDSVSKAKSDMNEAWNAYNTYKNSNSNSGETDTTVSDSLKKTVEEKQLAYDKAVTNLDGVEKDIEADVQKEIEKASVNESGNPITLTQEEKQKIREQVNARPENVSLLQNANDQINTAKDALTEAENALSAYNEQQNNSSSASYDEQLKTLYDDYKAKEEAYNEAVKQRQSTIQSANRTLEDAKAPENVDTATALTANDDLEEKQLAVDELQKVMDVNGKITAPSDGLITKVNVTTGETTTEDTAIRISDQSAGYKFTATLDKASAKYLSKDDKVIKSPMTLAVIEGLIRIAIFFIYIVAISQMKDIQRVFMYHGAEHKTINCIEHGAELTPENAAKYSRLHKRCGTSFLLIVMVVSIICFMFIRVDNMALKIVLRVILVPVIAGVSFEIIQWAGRSESCLVNIVSKPGLMLQKLTTREPDLEMLEVAIASIEAIYDWRQFQAENRAAADGNSQKTDRSNAGVSQP